MRFFVKIVISADVIFIILLLDIEYLKETLPNTIEKEFYDFLSTISAKQVSLYAIPEGSVVFPR